MNPTKRARILVAEDEADVRNYLELSLRCHGYDVEQADNGEEVMRSLRGGERISLVLMDIMMPLKDGIETLREIRHFDKDLPVVILSGGSAPATIVESMKCGADDYLTKPASQEQLLSVIEKTLAKRAGANTLSIQGPRKRTDNSGVNPSAWMQRMETTLRQVAVSDASVLLQGETGSGKEVVARMLHGASSRGARPFLKVNCAALPSELVESELFGYERGAFTGAIRSKCGKFDLANSGTIFLDEIGDMDFRLQAKLLQVLQDQEFQRLGGKEMVHVDVRVMAATHTDLEQAIQNGRFREDLYYRLNVVNIHVPALRDRADEILPLARYLLEKHAVPGLPPLTVSMALAEALVSYDWPGNVRELENTMRKYLALRDGQEIVEDLRARARRRAKPSDVRAACTVSDASPSPAAATLQTVSETQRQAEVEAILAALNRNRWNRKKAAASLRVDYKALLYKMKKLNIDDTLPGDMN